LASFFRAVWSFTFRHHGWREFTAGQRRGAKAAGLGKEESTGSFLSG